MSCHSLVSCAVGDLIRFAEERNPYRVRARGERYLVCNKPFAPRKTTIYCIVDLERGIRGPENLILGMGAETPEHCEEMLARLEGRTDLGYETEVSRRRSIPVILHSVKSANDKMSGRGEDTK